MVTRKNPQANQRLLRIEAALHRHFTPRLKTGETLETYPSGARMRVALTVGSQSHSWTFPESDGFRGMRDRITQRLESLRQRAAHGAPQPVPALEPAPTAPAADSAATPDEPGGLLVERDQDGTMDARTIWTPDSIDLRTPEEWAARKAARAPEQAEANQPHLAARTGWLRPSSSGTQGRRLPDGWKPQYSLGVVPAGGAWVAYYYSNGADATMHASEVDALRHALGKDGMAVVFVPWGSSVAEAERAARESTTVESGVDNTQVDDPEDVRRAAYNREWDRRHGSQDGVE